LTASHGNSGRFVFNGGAIAIATGGNVELNGVVVSHSRTAGHGGALAIDESTVSINGCRFFDNVASGFGGAIFIRGRRNIDIASTSITGNSSGFGGGGINSTAHSGSLTIVDSVIDNNSANSGARSGGGLHLGSRNPTIVRGSVSNNIADLNGGGIYALGNLTIEGTVIDGNQTIGTGISGQVGGGGVFAWGTLNVTENTTISNNRSAGVRGTGGGILAYFGPVNLIDSTVQGNIANVSGGGVEVIRGDLNVTRSSIVDNTAGGADANPGNGGAIHVRGDVPVTVVLTDTEIASNVATASGGGLWNASGSTFVIDGTSISGNSAGGITADDGGGGIFNNGGVVQITSSRILDNDISGAAGGGGGIHNAAGGRLEIALSEINDNTALGNGGGIFNNGELFLDADSRIFNNTALAGGGIYTAVSGTLDLEDPCVVFANTPDNFGGIQPEDCDVDSEVSGWWMIDGQFANVVRSGNALSFINERGEVSRGRYLSETEIVAIDWNGLTGQLVGSRILWANGSTWSDSIVGMYTISSQFVAVEQNGEQLKFTNERGEVSSGRILDSRHVVADEWGGLVGEFTHGRIEWGNGTVWAAPDVPDVSGDYFRSDRPTNISRSGNELLFTNERGDVSRGLYINQEEVRALDWGGLVGEIAKGVIRWGNGSVWVDDISGEYTFDGQTTGVAQAGNLLTFTNEHGSVAHGRFLNETHFIATDWGGLIGEIVNGRLEWRNGSLWQPKAGYASADAIDRLFASVNNDWLLLLN
jgi:predicted outer membrane repeat protein